MKKLNQMAFTLIELLAVITIMGILMLVAIPSISLIIENARKDTIISTIDAYIDSLKAEVASGTYDFEDPDATIYAMPIECIPMESGGSKAYGEWMQASNDYWAYVLVQYDSERKNYNYGFTFKDSTKHGLYPTEENNLQDPQTFIMQNLDLYKPITGSFVNIAGAKDWAGFKLTPSTNLVVLEATEEGGYGDGKTTCTLETKGSNYEQVQAEKSGRYADGKPCRFVSGNGSNPGDLLACGSDKFYLLKDGGATMTLLSQYQIDVSTSNPRQNLNATGTYFANVFYWQTSAISPIPSKHFGGKYPTYTYGNYVGNNVYPYVKAYEDYLESVVGVRSAGLVLMSIEQTTDLLKCTKKPGSIDCNSSPFSSWINQGYRWMTGTINNQYQLWVLESTNSHFALGVPQEYPFPYGIRPMMIIDKNDIDM